MGVKRKEETRGTEGVKPDVCERRGGGPCIFGDNQIAWDCAACVEYQSYLQGD